MKWKKLRVPAGAIFKNKSQNLFVNWEKHTSLAYDQHSKSSILNLCMNKGNLCPNLSFTIENKK